MLPATPSPSLHPSREIARFTAAAPPDETPLVGQARTARLLVIALTDVKERLLWTSTARPARGSGRLSGLGGNPLGQSGEVFRLLARCLRWVSACDCPRRT